VQHQSSQVDAADPQRQVGRVRDLLEGLSGHTVSISDTCYRFGARNSL